ncbi:hypothetical protein [Candidatus Laterigemmans baculatus]|uniref:hypothetical protein n=1 Tax=Candidatus Laterigemmans baculatus TaxID=2770505 RepID=UPI0013D9BAA1|nr:hypothetical protein [Candidatus Laterigemmans baculatus]
MEQTDPQTESLRAKPLWRRPDLIAMFVFAGGFMTIALVVAASLLFPQPGKARSLALGIFAVLMFGSVGAGVAWLSVWVARELKREERAREQWPKQPWRWQEDWAKGEVTYSQWKKPAGLAVFALLWNAMSWFGLYTFVFAEQAKPEFLAALVVAPFCMIGIGLVVMFARSVCESRRWGSSRLVLKTCPAVIGNSLVGYINTSQAIAGESEIRLTLTCLESRIARAKVGRFEVGKGERYDHLLWQGSRVVHKRLPGAERESTRIPVAFSIPDGVRSSGSSISWVLEADADGHWPRYHSDFEVPVFRIQGGAGRLALDAEALGEWVSDETFASMVGRASGQVICDGPRSLELSFTTEHSRRVLIGQGLLGILWMIVSWGIAASPQVPMIIRFLFPLAGVILGGAIIVEWLTVLTLEVSPRSIVRRRRILGVELLREIEVADVEQVEVVQKRHGVLSLADQCVRVRTRNGKTHLLVHGLPQRVIGEAIARKVEGILAGNP